MEINSFSQRISKVYGNRKFGRFGVVLKLEFEVKNWYIHTKQLPNNLGGVVGSGNCLVVFQNPFFPFQPLFKLTKISLKFRFTPALIQVSKHECGIDGNGQVTKRRKTLKQG